MTRYLNPDYYGNVFSELKFFIETIEYECPSYLREINAARAVMEKALTPKILYHATTPKKARAYHNSGCIKAPVRGFTTLQAAMAWAMKVGRTVIYEIECPKPHKLPDHHNQFGEAWWNDGDITNFKCVFSANRV